MRHKERLPSHNTYNKSTGMSDLPHYYQGNRPEIVALIDQKPKRVLEIGCGDGSFRRLLDSECEYWGIEPFPQAAEQATACLDKVFRTTYEEAYADLPDAHFDLIICNDVIEHFTDHDYFFASIKQKMSSGARIVGSVPNVRHLSNILNLMLRKDWEYQDDGILDSTHYRFFTEKSLKRTFAKHDYQLEALQYLKIIKPRIHPPSRLGYNLLILLLGKDTRPLQFGFRLGL